MKLANFPEIRFWVIIGCSKTVFVSDEYYSILLTPFEALCALGMYVLSGSSRFINCLSVDAISGTITILLTRTSYWKRFARANFMLALARIRNDR